MRWDIFCRVIDNFGDVGVCWRLATDLAGRGEQVRLWLDDRKALTWLAPEGTAGVEVRDWPDGLEPTAGAEPGEVVIEAFACDPPADFVARMGKQPASQRPVWINLDYLSAEPWVARVHGLKSPQFSGPGQGQDKWFFQPGFALATGGLLREPGLMARRGAFDRDAWLAARGWARHADERVVLLFCYANPQLPALLNALSDAPTLLLLAQGPAQTEAATLAHRPGQRRIALPWLSQTDFDHALWSADLNLVRGEDSLVRAHWAGAPWVWQLYPQDDGAHAAKLLAYLAFLRGSADADADRSVPGVAALFQAWNGLAPWSESATASLRGDAWRSWNAQCTQRRSALLAQADLSSQLLKFVASKR